MNNDINVEQITLEQIKKLKKQKLEEIRAKQNTIVSLTGELMAPVREVSRTGNILTRSFGIGMTVIQGALAGLRMLRRFRGMFRRHY